MHIKSQQDRRRFCKTAAACAFSAGLSSIGSAQAAGDATSRKSGLGRVKQIKAGVLDVGYYELGPDHGSPVVLLHGFPYSAESYREVAPMLAERGCRVIVPHLRGHGSTRFLDSATPRSGQQGAIGSDLIAFMDGLKLKRATLAGYDWGGRAACIAAALWPDRCAGLVSVNSYLIQDIAKAELPVAPDVESGLWYQFYFLTERGRAGLTSGRREIAKTIWTRNSPGWRFSDDTLDSHASAFHNPDYVDVVLHSYRHRLGHARGYPAYEDIEQRLALLPPITVPSITIDGANDGVVPANDGASSASKFKGSRSHRVIRNAGHNLPEEAVDAFSDAVWELAAADH